MSALEVADEYEMAIPHVALATLAMCLFLHPSKRTMSLPLFLSWPLLSPLLLLSFALLLPSSLPESLHGYGHVLCLLSCPLPSSNPWLSFIAFAGGAATHK